jgi:acetoin utilization deacetylase AcuC-like enzyme
VAVAAREAQLRFGLERVLILDFDIHHGNGTQDIFYNDPSVLFMSLHLYGSFFYPGTGAARELGIGRGRGYNVNVPLPAYVGDKGYERVFDLVVDPLVDRFGPELILISAGFDAHWRDPLAYGGLSLTGYTMLARRLCALAEAHCQGKILFVLEGGYDLTALSHGALNVLYTLLGWDEISDPLGPMSRSEADVTELLGALQSLHLI